MVVAQASDLGPGFRAGARPETINAHVGRCIQKRRMLMGMSLEEFAAATGIGIRQVQANEKGLNRAGAMQLFDIARVLDEPISRLFGCDAMLPKSACKPVPAEDEVFGVQHGARPGPQAEDRQKTDELVRRYAAIADPFVHKSILLLAQLLAPS